VHQVEINIWRLEHIQALLQTLFRASVECAPELAGDEEVLALHDAALDNVLERLANLIFVLVAEGAVNVPVAALNCVNNGLLDLARRGLPCSQAKSWDRRTSVQRDCGVHFGRWVQDAVRSRFQDEIGQSGIHHGSG